MTAIQVVFTSPPQRSNLHGPGANPTVFTASVLGLDGGPSPVTSTPLPFGIPGLAGSLTSMMRLVDGGYAVSQPFNAVEGGFTAYVGWDGGPGDFLEFDVDTRAPQVALSPLPTPGPVYLRDMARPMLVRLDEAASVVATLQGTGAAANLNIVANIACSTITPASDAHDLCVRLDFAAPAFDALDGGMVVSVTATDLAGNSSQAATTLQVSRVRWRYLPNLTIGEPDNRVAPALDALGNLYVAENDASFRSGFVTSRRPDGTSRYSVPMGEVHGIAVAPTSLWGGTDDTVYVSSNAAADTDGRVSAFSAASGNSTGLAAPCNGTGDRPTWSALALYDAGMPQEGPLEVGAAVILSGGGSKPGAVSAYRPTSGCLLSAGHLAFAQPQSSATGPLSSPVNVVIAGARLYYQQLDRRIGYADLGTTLVRGGSSNNTFASGTPMGLALSDAALLSALSGAPTGAGLTVLALPTPAGFGYEPMGYDTAHAPVVISNLLGSAAATMTGGGPGTAWLRSTGLSPGMATFTGTGAAGVLSPSSLALLTSPVAGNGGFTYAVTGAGQLYVYATTAGSGVAGEAPRWSASVFGAPRVVHAHPTLDCNRLEGPTRPGTLYVTATDGSIAALIVDSTRLSATAPWPKWQRTAGNAGNPDFPLNPGCGP